MEKKNNQDHKMPSSEQTKGLALGAKRELYKHPSAGKENHGERKTHLVVITSDNGKTQLQMFRSDS